MQKRKVDRIRSRLKIWFSHGREISAGTVTDISENGMFIHADINFPFDSEFEVNIPFKRKLLKVPVKVSRLVRINNNYDTMAVEIMNSPKDYQEFVNRLKHVS